MTTNWQKDQQWELDWWGNCTNTFWEETKQQVYAKKMGLSAQMIDGKYPVFDVGSKKILDIGGGPTSLLLKCVNLEQGYVVDPCEYPSWVKERYRVAQILYAKRKGEDLQHHPKVDEVWFYNTLQHVQDPKRIIDNARKCSKIIRIFEWVNIPTSPGHPHELKEDKLNLWLGGEGKVERLNESGCRGDAYYGIFKGELYV
jgi:mannose-6-phosphate isomerase-like protein (cupin superfamily)